MYGSGACEIMEAHFGQPAATPNPVTADGIYQHTNQNTINAVNQEVGTFSHSTGYDGSCGSTEHGLENEEAGGRISSAIITLHKEIRCADKAAYVLAEHQTKAQNPEDDGAQAHVHYILHYDVSSVFGSGKASLYHGEARLHRKYQEGTD